MQGNNLKPKLKSPELNSSQSFSSLLDPIETESSSTFSLKTAKDDNANKTEQNISHFPSISIQNQFQILDQTFSSNSYISTLSLVPCSSLVTTTHMDTTCSLKTITSLHPTSSNLPITSSPDRSPPPAWCS